MLQGILYSSKRKYLCNDEYQLVMGQTDSHTLMVYYYTDENVDALDFTLYFQTKGRSFQYF